MGTRGTLRVYLDDELKVRQYNQWDSYPTGQFADICEFMSDDDRVKRLVERLVMCRFYTKEEWDKVVKFDETGVCDHRDITLVSQGMTLCNRDYGASILEQILCLCRLGLEGYLLPDWAMVFSDGDDLEDQEGNYVIRLYADIDKDHFGHATAIKNIRFELSGDWHGVERKFYLGIPGEDTIKEWEEEGYRD